MQISHIQLLWSQWSCIISQSQKIYYCQLTQMLKHFFNWPMMQFVTCNFDGHMWRRKYQLFSVAETHIVNIWLKMFSNFVNWRFMQFVTWNFDGNMELWKYYYQFHKKNIVNLTHVYTTILVMKFVERYVF